MIKFWRGYKYVIAEDFTVQTAIIGHVVMDNLTSLDEDGCLKVRKGYPWDGNSGPCYDFDSSLKASCVHDVLCDYINMGSLPVELQPMVDQEYYVIATGKGMWWRWARARLLAIRWYMTGKGAKRFTRKVYEA